MLLLCESILIAFTRIFTLYSFLTNIQPNSFRFMFANRCCQVLD